MDIACPSCTAPYEIDDASVTEAGRKVRCASCSTVWRVYPALAASTVAPTDPSLAMDPDANPFATEPPEDIFGDGGPKRPAETVSQSEESAQAVVESAAPAPPAEISQMPDLPPTPETPDVSHMEAAPPSRARLTKDRKPTKTAGNAKSQLFTWKTGAIAAAIAVLGIGIHQREAAVRFVPQIAGLYTMIGLPVNLRGIAIKDVASRMLDDNGVQILVIDGDLQNVSTRKVDVPRLRFAVRGNDGQEIYVWSAQADKASLQPGETLNFRRRLAAPPNDGKDVSVRFLTRSDTTGGLK